MKIVMLNRPIACNAFRILQKKTMLGFKIVHGLTFAFIAGVSHLGRQP